MDGERGPALGAQLARDRIAAALGLAEDEQARPVHLPLQQAAERPVLLLLAHELELLLYHVVRLHAHQKFIAWKRLVTATCGTAICYLLW